MIPLPIVERELRAASRRKSTHRIRLYTTLVASAICLLFMFIYEVSGQTMPGFGAVLFGLLAHYAFGLSLLAGIFFAADSISEEKREGTLGLLFLTDLRGVDVVLGKLASCGLASLYGLIAVMPVIALPLLMGGTTGGQFWRTALALINNLFFALSLGILVSTVSKQAHRAMLALVGALILAVIVLPALGAFLHMLSFPWPFWYVSPYPAMSLGMGSNYRPSAGRFWTALLTSHAFAWLMIGVASWLLPRIWQEKQFGPYRPAPSAPPPGATGPAMPLPRREKRLMLGDANPIQWLVERTGNLRLPAWLGAWVYLAAALIMIFLVLPRISLPGIAGRGTTFTTRTGPGVTMTTTTVPMMRFGMVTVFGWATAILSFLLKILVAVQACKFFSEARRSGALEILVSTPLTAREFIEGQWRGLRRSFLWPVVIFLSVQLAFSVATSHFVSRNLILPGLAAGPNPVPFWLRNFFTGWGMGALVIAGQIYVAAHHITNLLAIGWVGMWLSLSSKNPNLAPAMTILFVVVLPNVVFCVPGIIPDLIFIFWAQRQLQENFRRHAFPGQWSYAGLPGLAPAPARFPAGRT